jgi:hypothetical protein
MVTAPTALTDMTAPESGWDDWRFAFEERAAVLEYDEGLSRPVAEQLAAEQIARAAKAGSMSTTPARLRPPARPPCPATSRCRCSEGFCQRRAQGFHSRLFATSAATAIVAAPMPFGRRPDGKKRWSAPPVGGGSQE